MEDQALKDMDRLARPGSFIAYDHTPDAELHLEGIVQIAIEVECSAKSYDRLDTILRALTATYPQVFYAVTAQVCPVIFEACSRLELELQRQITLVTL